MNDRSSVDPRAYAAQRFTFFIRARRMGFEVLMLAVLASGVAGCAVQSSASYDGAMTVTLENDTFTNSDNNYTNGIGATWVSNDLETYDSESFVHKWGKFWSFLPFVSDEGYQTYAAWSLAQEMNTPDEDDDPNPPEDDQPYAGILYVDSVLYARKERWAHAWELKLGVVGPASQAEYVQKKFHELIGSEEPMGWDTQLPNEPVINVTLTTAHLLAKGRLADTVEWRIVPVGSLGLGTYFTGAGLGTYVEAGWNLVDALGGTALREGLNAASTAGVGPVDGWSVAFFGGVGGYGVVRYLPLDGTLFRDSRSVDTEPWIGMHSFGFAVRHRSFAVSFAKTFFTDAFETARQNSEFGTLSVSWYF
jgi:hypothetical protein